MKCRNQHQDASSWASTFHTACVKDRFRLLTFRQKTVRLVCDLQNAMWCFRVEVTTLSRSSHLHTSVPCMFGRAGLSDAPGASEAGGQQVAPDPGSCADTLFPWRQGLSWRAGQTCCWSAAPGEQKWQSINEKINWIHSIHMCDHLVSTFHSAPLYLCLKLGADPCCAQQDTACYQTTY